MAFLIGAVLLLTLAYATYRSVRRFVSQKPGRNPVLARALDNAGSPPGAARGAREAELSRQLLIGRLDRADYRQAMADLAHSGLTRSGSTRAGGPK